jgi:uncharacterized protein YegP (UPF0339 family)
VPDKFEFVNLGTGPIRVHSNAQEEIFMIKNILGTSLVLAAFSFSTLSATAATGFYVSQDAKTHKCSVVDKAPDGKMAMDAGTKMYDSQANAEKAMAMLKVCGAADAMAPAAMAKGFYVESDAKTKKCMVTDKAADGKTMMDVGTKMYDSKANAEKAMANLAACK